MEISLSTNPLQEIYSNTAKAFSDLQEGHVFTEKYEYMAIIAIVRKNLVVLYQGTPSNLIPVCYDGPEDVRKKFANSGQSGYWVTFLKNDKEYLDKIING